MKMSRRVTIASLLICILAAVAQSRTASAVPSGLQRVLQSFSKQALRAHMAFLADDLLEGRGTGTRGQEIAARYMAEEFEALGLEPAGDMDQKDVVAHGMPGRSYFQWVPLREITIDRQQTEVAVEENGQPLPLVWGTDFLARGYEFSEQSEITAPVVFVGYGVVDPMRNYDDYAGIDVRGKIVAMLYGAPSGFPSAERADRSSSLAKTRAAAEHGAVGIITLRTRQSDQLLPWARTVVGAELPSFRWLDPNGQPADSFPEIKGALTFSTDGSEKLFRGAPRSFSQVAAEADSENGTIKGFPLPATLRMKVVSTHIQVRSPNVLGILRGSDPLLKNEYVVYSAHTDHLGIGRAINGDSIYNGALDDGSGCAALIEMASAFTALPARPRRSILFAAFTGEEKGLLGADYFVHGPGVPIGSIAANLNMDGASVFYVMKDIAALGVEHTNLEPLVQRSAAVVGLKLSPDPMPEQVGFIRNDQYPFVRQGIPALWLRDGMLAADPKVNGRKVQEDWIATRYHSPQDDMTQPLNFDATLQYMKVNFLIGYDVAQQRGRPAWKQNDFFGELYGQGARSK